MADMAMVFYWRPADMDEMAIAELMEWRERARVRVQTQSV